MRWVSRNGEFAFLSVGNNARGIIAVGSVARGVLALGGGASVGVISIGLNAAGSLVAIGVNAVAPISISAINGLGIYSLAGINSWGVWAYGGTNSSGVITPGGVNSGQTWLPAVFVITLMLVLSSFFRGKREPRTSDGLLSLRRFIATPELAEARVRARLVQVDGDKLELVDGRRYLTASMTGSTARNAAAISGSGKLATTVIADLVRTEERAFESQPPREPSYRERPRQTTRVMVLCNRVLPAPPSSWMPKDAGETQWVIAWTARLAALVAVGVIAIVAAG